MLIYLYDVYLYIFYALIVHIYALLFELNGGELVLYIASRGGYAHSDNELGGPFLLDTTDKSRDVMA